MKLLTILFSLVLLVVFTPTVQADHCKVFGCDDVMFGTYDRYNPAIQELRVTQTHRWNYVQEDRISILGAVVTGLEEYSAEFEILMQYDASSPYVQYASGGMSFVYGNASHGPCGSWAIGCLPDFPSKPHVVYDAIAMQPWPLRSQIEVVLHEIGHQIGNFGEGYRESYIYGEASCSGTNRANLSVMGCGLFNAQYIMGYEREAWAETHGIRSRQDWEKGTGNNGAPYLFWCLDPSEVKAYNGGWGKIKWVALMAYGPSGYHYAGVRIPLVLDNNGCQGFHYSNYIGVDEVPCFNLENGANIRVGRTDTCI